MIFVIEIVQKKYYLTITCRSNEKQKMMLYTFGHKRESRPVPLHRLTVDYYLLIFGDTVIFAVVFYDKIDIFVATAGKIDQDRADIRLFGQLECIGDGM